MAGDQVHRCVVLGRKLGWLGFFDARPGYFHADDEKTKQKKKKLVKSFKSKQRFQQMDTEQKHKADAWKSFIGGKGAKTKSGFMTGRKKGSMFSVEEGSEAKVGVVGSGKGMTQYGKRKRHEFGGGGEGSGGQEEGG